MARVTRYECDKCGRFSNGDTESWWVVETGLYNESVKVTPLDKSIITGERTKHVCGMECALSLVQDAMRSIHHEPASV